MSSSVVPTLDRVTLRSFDTSVINDDYEDLRVGLRERPVRIPSRYSYNEIGSKLYEERIRQDEYYQFRLEQDILKVVGADIKFFSFDTICELGAGSALKVSLLINAMEASHRALRYCPIDVNGGVLHVASTELAKLFPALSVEALVGTYEQGLTILKHTSGSSLFMFVGSTIGNLEDEEIIRMIQLIGRHCKTEDRLLITADLKKDPSIALKAYQDAAGIGAQMELNVLTNLNELFAANFELSKFAYQPIYDENLDRVEAQLISLSDQKILLPMLNQCLSLCKGDVIRTDIMRKFTRPNLENVFKRAGCSIDRLWTESKGWYGAFLLSFPATKNTVGCP